MIKTKSNFKRYARAIAILSGLTLLPGIWSCKADKTEIVDGIATNNQLISGLDKTVDGIVKPYMMNRNNIGMSIGIYLDEERFYYGYGEIAKESGKIPDEETIFEIGSITKTFTAAMLCQQLKMKGLGLDSESNLFLPTDIPNLQRDGETVKLVHLLNHTSGLPELPDDFFDNSNHEDPYAHYDSARIFEYLKTNPIKSKPGTIYQYSNLGMAVAGLILERLTGISYENCLIGQICDPLGLNHTRLDIPKNRATGYHADGSVAPYYSNMGGFIAAGAIESSVRDMLRYGEKQFDIQNNPLAETFNECHQVTFSQGWTKIGLGWFHLDYIQTDLIGHNGGTHGFSSALFFCKPKRVAIILLTNNYNEEFYRIAENLAKLLTR